MDPTASQKKKISRTLVRRKEMKEIYEGDLGRAQGKNIVEGI